jgi:hypothetical protein
MDRSRMQELVDRHMAAENLGDICLDTAAVVDQLS